MMPENSDDNATLERLRRAAGQAILACDANATILWEMSYASTSLSFDDPPLSTPFVTDPSGRMIAFRPTCEAIAFDDTILDAVEAAWEKIMGPLARESEFMRFKERPGEETKEY